jgi:hypothetical protein
MLKIVRNRMYLIKFESEAHKHLLHRLRDLELHTIHTPYALQFGILPNPQ